MITLPRQARDKHRENSKRDAFSYSPSPSPAAAAVLSVEKPALEHTAEVVEELVVRKRYFKAIYA